MDYEFDRTTEGQIDEDVDVATGFGSSLFGALAESFHGVYYSLFSGLDWTDRFQDRLAAANISTTADLWISGAFAVGAIVGGSLASLFALLAVVGLLPLPVPSFSPEIVSVPETVQTAIEVLGSLLGVVTYSALGGFLGFVGGGGVAVLVPYLRSRSRKRRINLVMPDGVAYMHALGVSGMNEMEIFQAISEAEDSYGEFAKETRRITYKTRHLNYDFRTAVREVAETSPSDEYRQFLYGFLSTLGAGGSVVNYLENQKEKKQNEREQRMEGITDYIQVLGQGYTVGVLLPMLLVIVLIIGVLIGQPNDALLLMTIYLLIPIINIAFGIMVSSIQIDSIANGYLRDDDGKIPGRRGGSPFDPGTEIEFLGDDPIFEQLYRKETESRLVGYFFENPYGFFRQYPKYSILVTAPIAILGYVALLVSGQLAVTPQTFVDEPVYQTILWFYWPLVSVLIPYAILYSLSERDRKQIMSTLADDFRALAEYNNQRNTLPEAMKEVGANSKSKLAEEFATMYKKLQIRQPISHSLLEFNNKYHIPELARQVKILEQTQNISSHIGDVIETAAKNAEYQQLVHERRKSKMKVYYYIIEGTFLVFVLIMLGIDVALVDFAQTQLSGADELLGQGSSSLNTSYLSMLFLHAALLQGFFGGMLGGYIKHDDIRRGVTPAFVNATIVVLAWATMPYYQEMITGAL
jgi:flagellar protein FlaJ